MVRQSYHHSSDPCSLCVELSFEIYHHSLMNDDCLFCKIIAGEIPSKKVYEDERVYAFEDIDPKASDACAHHS